MSDRELQNHRINLRKQKTEVKGQGIMESKTPPPPQWVIDLSTPPIPKSKSSSIQDPPGYSNTATTKRSAASKQQLRKAPTTAETDTLKLKKSWELALAPAKALPMNAIMMYMSGNTLQIFSIMMVFMLFKNPLQALLQTNQVFTKYETDGTRAKLWMVKGITGTWGVESRWYGVAADDEE
ncbi:hypothetical protein MMC11_007377 [Xylographa trunciseda]|nr:hypothetical protein [Xylographa trunciseda]